jgi:hypothetical protein
MKRLLAYLIVVINLGLTFNVYADSHSNDLKKINEQLNSVKKLFDTGVLDEEGYKSAKNRLDEKKKIILSKNKKNKKKSTTSISKTLEKQIEVLENLLKDGVLSEEEFLKTKKYLIDKEKDGGNILLNDEVKIPSTYVLNVKKVPGRGSWEKAEMIFENYKVITYRPGGIKVVRISDNKKLLRITDNYKIKYFNNGEDVLSIKKTEYQVDRSLTGMTEGVEGTIKDITEVLKNPFKKRKKAIFDTTSHKLELFINNKRALHYVGRYVKRHRAFFYQVLTDKSEPFHFYIKIDAKNAIALNMEYFNVKIDRAVRKAKKRLSLEFNVTEEEIERIVEDKVGEETNKAIEESMEKAINDSVVEAIKQSVGEVLSAALVNAIEEATGEAIEASVEAELASAINEEIARAVAQGIDEAAVTAGWEAYFEVLAAGGTAAEASAKAYETCGSACDNY